MSYEALGLLAQMCIFLSLFAISSFFATESYSSEQWLDGYSISLGVFSLEEIEAWYSFPATWKHSP